MAGGQRSYTVNPEDYKLLEEVGYGASATVYRAIYVPLNEVVAVKCLDLDRCNSNLDDIRKEAQIMSLIGHPNLIKAFCSFVVDHYLWVVMPFMAEGSCLHLMKIAYPDGFEEAVIGSILKETLKALEYLHLHGHIHRDVKAGNILLDTNGVVKLADFGVSACMFDRGDRQHSRNTFTGTPCWMAPEVLQPGTGYDYKADIWSLGITALELAHGHAPFSKYPPMKVLLMTINSAPPGLDYDRDKKFSKSFKEMVAMCLVKDQTKRPTAEKLLRHSFFKNVKPPEISIKKLFAGLPPLWNREKALQLKDAAQLAMKKMPSSEEEAISQSEYKRGVSAWNFDLEDLKFQASMVQDDDEIPEFREEDESMKSYTNYKENLVSAINDRKPSLKQDTLSSEQEGVGEVTLAECQRKTDLACNKLDSDHQEKGRLKKNSSKTELPPLTSDKDAVHAKSRSQTPKTHRSVSGPLMPGVILSHSASERAHNFERSKIENQQVEKAHQVRRAPSFSGPLTLPNRASANSKSAPINSSGGLKDSLDDKSVTNLVQIKGRFSVTSENVDLVKGSQLRKAASVGDWILDSKLMPPGQLLKELGHDNVPASLLMPHLQNLFQQTSIQQDLIMNLLSSLQLSEAGDASQHGKLSSPQRIPENNGSVEAAVSERERMLLVKVSELQARMISLTDELTTEKLKYMQLQQQLNAMSSREEDWDRRELDS
ncbi:PREDICTED: serine/threonine-protein kinase BLUS1-like isoform X1 [Nicotiana attenuata]|uniref:Serinethreonine-protein kinase blus1 n=2 Tax=Nicotiana attenuata TaxID=49451 RepID=A0A1J6II66_NICAT|nr:PREDICTED: serine/threonine-protein kinase BLUS1-like isoform X1 [Nicotiana attenuata]XP_019244984.1 PREDICTED: serine/threonine-protein kinase BLUS1-like isoform X1 [Nicotiana attenuata]XP_019244985.1 PREDICTED: serine/threonine-protein kinase BLUS1-like isoform X1 [Nicotiana attenuata]OIT04036.1 serinethreonine-protein kinase blus1 [Nicotiana attenuata]